jgi:hypothetical protein
MTLFKVLGVALSLYVVYGVSVGEIYAKRGIWGGTVKRDERPLDYWAAIVAYAGLSLALFFVF